MNTALPLPSYREQSPEVAARFLRLKQRPVVLEVDKLGREFPADGKNVVLDVENGTGQANFTGLFAEIKKSKWSGVMAIETDNKAFAEDPNKLVASAKTFFEANTGKK